MRVVLIAVTLCVGLVWSPAEACSRCDDALDLRSTAIRAGLVVVAHQVGDEHTADSGPDRGTTFATFEVEKVLKGSAGGNHIDVATSWMCGQGVRIAWGRSAVLFLERYDNHYYTVRDGCAVTDLPIEEGKVVLRDIALPVDVLARELGFAWAEDHREPPCEIPWKLLIPAYACIVAAVFGFLFGRRRRVDSWAARRARTLCG